MEFLVEKVGMSRTLGVPSLPVTLVKVVEAKVVAPNNDGKSLVAYSKGKVFNKAIEGQQKKYNLSKEFNNFISLDIANASEGDLDYSQIEAGKTVKVSFDSKGRGFTGVIKRHNFSGGPGAHGSRFHRAPGSIGNCEWPGRVQKGRKMPGQYGAAKVTVINSIVSYDADSKVVALKGSIPGANGSFGKLRIV